MAGKRGNGEGTVCQRKDGRWIAVISVTDETGKWQRRGFYGKTRAEAVTKMNAEIQDRKAGVAVDPTRITLGQFLEQWLEDTVRPTTRLRTYEGYAFLVRKHISPGLGHIQLQKLTPRQVQQFLNSKSGGDLSTRTVQFLRDVLRQALNRAVKWGLVPRNVVMLVDPPKVTLREARPLDPECARSFLDAVRGHRWEALYVTTLLLGLRRGEVLGLQWSDVDFAAGTLTIQRSLQRAGGKLQLMEPKTKGSKRVVTMPKAVMLALRGHRARQLEERLQAGPGWTEQGLVFTTGTGTPIEPRNLNRSFARLLADAGLAKMRFHDLRHSTCSILLSQGVPVKAVSELLGHSDVTMTLRTYTHVFDSMRQEAADQMDRLMTAG